MADCSNLDIRELLPERGGGALSAADMARVDAHLASCALCRSELALIQAARRVLRVSPSIDVARIASAVIEATTAPSRPQLVASAMRAAPPPVRPRLRWVGWKAAAAIAVAAAGAGTFASWHSANEPVAAPNGVEVPAKAGQSSSPTSAAVVAHRDTTTTVSPATTASAPRGSTAAAELAIGGALSDLSDGDLQTLLGDLGDRGAVAPDAASFEEPDVTEPGVGITAVWEGL